MRFYNLISKKKLARRGEGVVGGRRGGWVGFWGPMGCSLFHAHRMRATFPHTSERCGVIWNARAHPPPPNLCLFVCLLRWIRALQEICIILLQQAYISQPCFERLKRAARPRSRFAWSQTLDTERRRRRRRREQSPGTFLFSCTIIGSTGRVW